MSTVKLKLIVFGLVVAAFVVGAAGQPAFDKEIRWRTYENRELGFTVRYPHFYTAWPSPEPPEFQLEQYATATPIWSVEFGGSGIAGVDRGAVTIEVWSNPARHPSVDEWLDKRFPKTRLAVNVEPISVGGVRALRWLTQEQAFWVETVLPAPGLRIFWARLRLPDRQQNAVLNDVYSAMLESLVGSR